MYLEIDGFSKSVSISADGKACSEMAGVSAKVFFGVAVNPSRPMMTAVLTTVFVLVRNHPNPTMSSPAIMASHRF